MVKRYKGGLMGGTEAVTSVADARGVWGIVQATQARYSGNWPALLTTETPGLGSGAGAGSSFMTVSNVAVTDSSYTVLNDTPNISTAGGYIRVTGRGFVSGCVVYVGGTPATSTTFVSSTEVRAQIAAATSNTLMVYVVNPDGSTGIKLNSLVFSGTPAWSTGTSLTTQITGVAFNIQFAATSDSAITAYTLNTGSSLPPGTTLYANGLFTGTVTGITSDTTYSFSVLAIDSENQDTARTFSVTVSSGDQYLYVTPLLLNGDANVWITDSSTNKFLTSIAADTKPTAFSPYNSNWSAYFDGSGDYLDVGGSSNLAFGTNDFTIEFFTYIVVLNTFMMFYDSRTAEGLYPAIYKHSDNTIRYYVNSGQAIAGPALAANTWYHIVVSRVSGITRMFVNGTQVVSTYTDTNNYLNGAGRPRIGANGTDATSGVNGYISNLRVLNGTGYTSVTVPTAPLTAIANTQLLTLQDNRFKDNSTNAYTITRNGDTAIRSFGPFTETDATTGSGYFDGAGDYLVYNTYNTTFGAGDFTVECWVYMPVITNTFSSGIIGTTNYNGVDRGWALDIVGATGYPRFYLYNSSGTGVTLNSSTLLPANQWTHLAAVRSGTTVTIYMNGVSIASGTNATSDNFSAPIYIGTIATSFALGQSTYSYAGYISNARIVVGTAIYTANFTPATSSLSSVANTSLLTLQHRRGDNNHRFVDEGGNKYIATRGGNASQGTFSPFSPAGWSAYFDGTGDYLSVPYSSGFGFTGDFTIECWIYWASASHAAYAGILSCAGSGDPWTGGWQILFDNTNNYFRVEINGSLLFIGSGITLTPFNWYHIALVRSGSALTLYYNGISAGTGTSSATIDSVSSPLLIGVERQSGAAFLGYITNVRIVKGVAVYTGNFTVPTTTLSSTQSVGTNISAITSGQTSILTLQNNRFIDANTTPKSITRNGDVKIQAFSPFRPSGEYNPVTHGGSAYFDGSGDYLKALSTSNTLLPTSTINTFTVDGWIYPTTTGTRYWIVGDIDPTGPSNNVSVDVSSTNKVELYWYTGSVQRATSADSVVPNQWNYFAIVVNANAINIYVNSTTAGQTGTTTLTTRSLATVGWGMGTYNSAEYFTGYMSGIRWSTGIARTISAIPTAPPAPDNYSTLLFNFTQGGIVDATGRANFETVADAKVANVQSKFGIGSLYFDGTGDYLLSTPTPDLEFGSGDFTIEFWWYPTSTVRQGLYHGSFGTDWSVGIDYNSVSTNKIGIWASSNGSSWNLVNADGGGNGIGTTTITQNQWSHIAYVRSGTSWMLFVNGSRDLNITGLSGTIVNRATSRKAIGAWWSTGAMSQVSGYFDDFRISKYARYTSAFTPPTLAFQAQ